MMRDLDARLARCTLEDQASLRRRARRLPAAVEGRSPDPRWARLERDLARSEALFERRRQAVPVVRVPPQLPIAGHVDDIVASIRDNSFTIVSGETGSGKSTQLPKLCLLAGRGVAGQIAHTQPRRVAARGVARRLAEELDQPLGESVGFKVRFDARVRRESHIKVLTDGLLLAELGRDRMLRSYDTVIVDEAHERSLNIDFLLGYLKQLARRRPELRVVISSATLDEARLSAFFDGAPVVRVAGRSYPVEVRHRDEADNRPLADQVRDAVDELCRAGPGDILVFLSGEREIHDVGRRLRAGLGAAVEVLALYARLPLAQQDRIFAPHTKRRVVLATNVAETSLTVPGVRYVVDAGFARVGRYSPGSAVQRLPVERISRASARQRAGRCGREAPGICIRLYDEASFDAFEEFEQPEILRTDLAAVLLRLRALGINDISRFPFLDPPRRRHVNDGLRLLDELGAIDAQRRLTRIGRQLARLPLDPRVGRMLIAAGEFDCVAEVLVIAAGLSAGDPRERERDQRGVRPQHLRYEDERSDFMRFLRIWEDLRANAPGARPGPLGQLCRRRKLSYARIQEWREVHLQLTLAAREMGLRPRQEAAGYARVHRALLAGLLRHVGHRRDEREYHGIRGNTFRISRGSGQSERRPRWVLAAEVVDAGSAFAHTVAGIRAQWVERAAGALIRRSHFDAWWDDRRGEPMVHEQTALYALTVTRSRAVRFAPVSESGAREVFIRAALVDGRHVSEAPFLVHNRALIERRRGLEARLRRPDPAISDERLFQFYDERLPDGIWDVAGFEAWWPDCDARTDATLHLEADANAADIDSGSTDESALARSWPERIAVQGRRLVLDYRFAPGEEGDGVTVTVPAELVGGLDEAQVEWAIPGLLRDRVIALLRALPKSMRRRLGPAAQVADAFLEAPAAPELAVTRALAAHLAERHGVTVDEDDVWSESRQRERLPPHLRLRYRLLDADGGTLAAGRDLAALKQRHAGRAAPAVAARDGRSGWVFGRLPDTERLERDGAGGWLYPALAARGPSVTVVRLDDADRAHASHREGLLRLVCLGENIRVDRLARAVPDGEALCLLNAMVAPAPFDYPAGPAGWAADGSPPLADVVRAGLESAFLEPDPWEVRDEAAFRERCAAGRERLDDCIAEQARSLRQCLEAHRQVRQQLAGDWPQAWKANLEDAEEQLRWLVHQGFFARTPASRRAEVPRYLAALARRLDKLAQGGARDGDKLEEIRPLWDRYLARFRAHQRQGREDPAMERYRWQLEEFRVSLFAQEIGASERVSRQRLDRLWATIPA